MNGYRSPLGSLTAEKRDAEQIKRDGWHQQKILVVSLEDDRLDWVQREYIRQIGNDLYGK